MDDRPVNCQLCVKTCQNKTADFKSAKLLFSVLLSFAVLRSPPKQKCNPISWRTKIQISTTKQRNDPQRAKKRMMTSWTTSMLEKSSVTLLIPPPAPHGINSKTGHHSLQISYATSAIRSTHCHWRSCT